MIASKFIVNLQNLIDKHGDLEVSVRSIWDSDVINDADIKFCESSLSTITSHDQSVFLVESE